MSVTVHGAGGAEHSPHPRLVVAAAVVAMLAVVAGPALGLGGVGRWVHVDRGPALTPIAKRVLDQVPGAFETGGIVVVPAAGNPDILWTGALTPDLIAGPIVDLGVSGLAEPGYLPSGGTAPAWLAKVGTADQVYDDVGNLWFACTRWPGSKSCKGTLLVENAGQRYIFRSGLDLAPSPREVSSFRVLDLGRPRDLVLGGAPPDASRVMVRLAGGRWVEAQISDPGAIDGVTLWWVSVGAPVTDIRFLDAGGGVLATSAGVR